MVSELAEALAYGVLHASGADAMQCLQKLLDGVPHQLEVALDSAVIPEERHQSMQTCSFALQQLATVFNLVSYSLSILLIQKDLLCLALTGEWKPLKLQAKQLLCRGPVLINLTFFEGSK